MPTSRKRIGFLPTAEVQKIIDEISEKNNLSQSKVTGILVEEALKARNIYDSKKSKEINADNDLNDYTIYNEGEFFNKNKEINEENEFKLIKEYLNYKNFKRMLSKIKSEG